ncbi:uncharacterized protein LOC116200606 [Punica granatum]|uniref:Uncharacterized protein LOC116200606 n=1 Tax=Punica granatum TaxID=22663 RepID=A0A6P8CYW4_PUNGR|nr:uncharacterized protein LOC116200606 [Punica granatum]
MKRASERLNVLLHSLQASSLSLEDDDSDYVLIHDIVHEEAITIASMNRHILVINNDYRLEELPREKIKQSSIISMPWVDVFELPTGLQCLELKMFIFFADNNSSKVPNSFFEENHRTLCLDWSSDLDDITVIGKIKQLQLVVESLVDANISVVGVHGPRGVGKSTLMKQVVNRVSAEKLFDEVAMATVSVNPNVKRIQGEISDMLGLMFKAESVHGRGFQLRSRLEKSQSQNKKVLVILDDLWKELHLEEVGIPHMKGVKLLLTSRSQDGVPIMKGARERLNVLIRSLQASSLLLEDDDSDYVRIHDIVRELEKIEPGVLKSLARLEELKMENSFTNWENEGATEQSNAWLIELNNMPKPRSLGILIPDATLLLEDLPLRNLFNYRILVGDAWDWSSNHKESRTLKLMLDSRKTLLEKWLQGDCCGYEDEAMGNAKVEMPNLRRLTLQSLPEITSLGNNVYNPSLLSAGIISEITPEDDIGASMALPSGCPISLPSLEALELSQLPKLDEIWWRDTLLEQENLRALVLKDCGNLSSIFDSRSLIKSKNLEALTIESCMIVKQVFDLEELNLNANVRILLQLREMELVDLLDFRCMWNGNPKGAFQLRNLHSLKVTKCNGLSYLFPLSAAKALEQIKEMEIAEWVMMEAIIIMEEEEGQLMDTLVFQSLSSVVLKKMSCLATVAHGKYSISFPLLKKLAIEEYLKMRAFSMQEYSMPSEGGDHLSEENAAVMASLSFFSQKVTKDAWLNCAAPKLGGLGLVSMDSFKTIWHNEELISEPSSFRQLRYTHVRDCKNLTAVFPSALVERFQNNLKTPAIHSCPSVELIFEIAVAAIAKKKKYNPAAVMLHELEDLLLDDLPKSKHVLDYDSHALVGFPNLEKIFFKGCHSLTYFLPFATARNLLKLKSLTLGKSNNMLEVVADGDRGGGHDTLEPISFPRLKVLQLWSLESLISFSSGSCTFDFPSLEYLYIDQCNNLKTFIMRPATTSNHELMKLNRRFEDDFSPAATVGTLSQPLFDEKVELPRLEKIYLQSLGNLQKLWDDELPSGWRHYKRKTVAIGLLQLQEIDIYDCAVLEELIAGGEVIEEDETLPPEDQLLFPRLISLKFRILPNLKRLFPINYSMEWSLLKNLSAYECGKLKIFASELRPRSEEDDTDSQQALLSIEQLLSAQLCILIFNL